MQCLMMDENGHKNEKVSVCKSVLCGVVSNLAVAFTNQSYQTKQCEIMGLWFGSEGKRGDIDKAACGGECSSLVQCVDVEDTCLASFSSF